MPENLIELICSEKLKQDLFGDLEKLFRYTGTLHDNPSETMLEQVEEGDEEALWCYALWEAEVHADVDLEGTVTEVFAKHVFSKLKHPYPISLSKLVEIFLSFVLPCAHTNAFETVDSLGEVYRAFVNHLSNSVITNKASSHITICSTLTDRDRWRTALLSDFYSLHSDQRGNMTAGLKNLLSRSTPPEPTVLFSRNGIQILAVRWPVANFHGTPNQEELVICISGRLTEDSLCSVEKEVTNVLMSQATSVSLLEDSAALSTSARLPYIKNMDRILKCMASYLDSYYQVSQKKDSMDKRIRNAIYLLTESDKQTNDSIGLSLSVAAIEALLGQGKDNIAEGISQRIAALLEPDLDLRHDAKTFFKDLYDCRSRTLHGDVIDAEQEIRRRARHLAAAVLDAAVSRRDLVIRGDYPTQMPQDFLEELGRLQYQSGLPAGVNEYNVREYWRKGRSGKLAGN
jgi:hypothetical protein